MTLEDIAVALAVTAGVFLLTAAVVGTHASEARWETKPMEVRIAWTTFAISMALFMAAIWTGVAA